MNEEQKTMTLAELVKDSAEVVVNDQGQEKVVVDRSLWEQIVSVLEGLETFQPKTELGRQLWAARQEILASGAPLLNREALELEIAERRGGQS
jgi:hypothetical protein